MISTWTVSIELSIFLHHDVSQSIHLKCERISVRGQHSRSEMISTWMSIMPRSQIARARHSRSQMSSGQVYWMVSLSVIPGHDPRV